jgi:hypothetical protein
MVSMPAMSWAAESKILNHIIGRTRRLTAR